jgi:hypothetical protein
VVSGNCQRDNCIYELVSTLVSAYHTTFPKIRFVGGSLNKLILLKGSVNVGNLIFFKKSSLNSIKIHGYDCKITNSKSSYCSVLGM